MYGHIDIASFLTREGCDAAVTDAEGGQPLHYAANAGHLDIVQWLVEEGVFAECMDKRGQKPIHIARANK